jgi:carnitine O-acetyltransferase
MAYMINENSIQFNIVSKNLGAERMAFYLNEAASDLRELFQAELDAAAKKAKL